MENVVHHARLENILEKLVVVHGATGLDFKHPSLTCSMSISVETLQYFAFAAKKNGDARIPGAATTSENIPS